MVLLARVTLVALESRGVRRFCPLGVPERRRFCPLEALERRGGFVSTGGAGEREEGGAREGGFCPLGVLERGGFCPLGALERRRFVHWRR